MTYRLVNGDKYGVLEWTLSYFSGHQIFSTTDISHTLSEHNQMRRRRGLASRNLFGPVIPYGDIHQSFTGTLVKWIFDNFQLCFPIVLVLFLFTALPRIRCKLSVQEPCIARCLPATARRSCSLLVPCGRLSWLAASFWAHVNISHLIISKISNTWHYS